MSNGTLKHDAREIRAALDSNTYNVYHLTGGKLPRRIVDVKKTRDTLLVYWIGESAWIEVLPEDQIYQQ
jgi:hypothetical protein